MHNIIRFIDLPQWSSVRRSADGMPLPVNAVGDTRPFERSPALASEAQFANVALPGRFIYCDATTRGGRARSASAPADRTPIQQRRRVVRTTRRHEAAGPSRDQRELPPGTSVATSYDAGVPASATCRVAVPATGAALLMNENEYSVPQSKVGRVTGGDP
jgi:hypothetical protein